jgi:hypothetical protein
MGLRLYNVYGNLVSKNVSKYKLDWDKKSRSIIQFQTKQFLKPYWFGHVLFEEFPVYGSLLKVDILNFTNKIAIEVNGPQHSEFHHFHNGKPSLYLKSIQNDMLKIDWLEKNEFKVIEINFDEVPKLSPAFFLEKFGVTL